MINNLHHSTFKPVSIEIGDLENVGNWGKDWFITIN